LERVREGLGVGTHPKRFSSGIAIAGESLVVVSRGLSTEGETHTALQLQTFDAILWSRPLKQKGGEMLTRHELITELKALQHTKSILETTIQKEFYDKGKLKTEDKLDTTKYLTLTKQVGIINLYTKSIKNTLKYAV